MVSEQGGIVVGQGTLNSPVQVVMIRKLLFEFVGSSGNQQANNQTKKTQDGAEDFDDEDFDESAITLDTVYWQKKEERIRTSWDQRHQPKQHHFH